jgi:UDP-N-acetyl-D-mannosaminuronic acid dehydrogenase
MPLLFDDHGGVAAWSIRKIAVIGPGIVGMPMAALLAHARIREGSDQPATVVVIQRPSLNSGWKVDAINAGRSPIGGVEPDLDRLVKESREQGLLSASHDPQAARDADVVLVCVQTDKKGQGPDYGPMFDALNLLADALRRKPAGNIPLVIFESTLAPSSMATLIRDHFADFGLVEGRDVLLGNSPNRVMPGRLVERVASSDKIVAGLHPETPGLIQRLYRHIVTAGQLHRTNSLTAEVVKTLENAYRDVRIAFSAEVVRYCDERDFDFYGVREAVNGRLAQSDTASTDPNAIPSGGLLIPTIGVGGHCLPKDGILLWWRMIESGADVSRSLILESRRINDESPAEALRLADRAFGPVAGRPVALLGAAYRFNSEDTRNSPTFPLARLLLERGCRVRIHDPHVRPQDQNIVQQGLQELFTNDLEQGLSGADLVFFCTAHREYVATARSLLGSGEPRPKLVDGCNLLPRDSAGLAASYCGIGRGTRPAPPALIDAVASGFKAVERGVANELKSIVDYLNSTYADSAFARIEFAEVQRIAGTCVTGCDIAEPGAVEAPRSFDDFRSRLVELAGSD